MAFRLLLRRLAAQMSPLFHFPRRPLDLWDHTGTKDRPRIDVPGPLLWALPWDSSVASLPLLQTQLSPLALPSVGIGFSALLCPALPGALLPTPQDSLLWLPGHVLHISYLCLSLCHVEL